MGMKWALVTAAALVCAFGLPYREYKTAQLLPIRCLQAQRRGQEIVLRWEEGEATGRDWQSAVDELRRKAHGELLFDTASELVVSDTALAEEAAESGELRPAAQVYFASDFADGKELHAYLTAHPGNRTLSDYMP
jgi:hypothetical protein